MRLTYRVLLTLAALALTGALGTTAQGGPTTITLWHIATEGDPFRPVLVGAIERFNATHDDVHIEARAIQNNTFDAELQSAIANGTMPDVFQTWGGGRLKALVDAGVARDIPELNAAGPVFVPNALAPSTFDGRHYAIPANQAGVFLWANQALFDQVGVALPATWGQFIEACRRFRQAGIVPVALGNLDRWPGGFWPAYLAMRGAGDDIFVQALEGRNGVTFADPAFVEAGRRVQEAVSAGCFEDGFNGVGYGEAQSRFANGGAAMQLQGDWQLAAVRGINPSLAETSLRVLPFPVVEGGRGSAGAMLGGTGQAFAISSDAPPEAGRAIIEMLSNPEYGQSVVQNGFIPALSGYTQLLTHPLARTMADALVNAPWIQLYYDQSLPPFLARTHLDTTYDLFGMALSPEQAAQMMAQAAREYVQVAEAADMPLRSLADARGMWIGSAVSVEPLRNNPRYADILAREFNMVTPEVAMKMGPLRPSRDSFAFEDADVIVQFAEQNGMAVRGHTLVWHRQNPGWLEQGGFSRDELIAILREHITTVVSRYRGRVVAWDVVNEAIDEDGSMRDTIWYRGIGPEYIDLAFQFAREADPDALLFYNDYDAEGLGAKSEAVYQLVQGLVQRGVPIDGVGMQMHISIGEPPAIQDVRANMERLAALGLEIHITEMDVKIQDGIGSEAERLAAQGQLYADITALCMALDPCTALVTWGFTDEHTWIPQETGNADLPLLYDRNYQPKSAYFAVKNALALAN